MCIEYFEVESQVFSVLQFLISTVASRYVRDFLSKSDTILLLCKLVSFGSPRITLLTLRIMESFAFRVSPEVFDSAMRKVCENEANGRQENQHVSSTNTICDDRRFVIYLLWRVGYFAGQTSALFIYHNVFNVIEANVPMRLSSGAGIGYLNSCISSTCVNLLRNMINWKKWQSYIQGTILNVIETCTSFLATQGPNDSYILPYAIAAFNVMGGSEDMLRIGARVRVTGSNGIGRVVGYYRGNSVALVAFRESVTCVPQAVRADNLSPLDDALPKRVSFH